MSRFLDLVNERVVVYDGATGTNLQELGLTADDYGGPELEGCTDILSVTRPDVIADLHEVVLPCRLRRRRDQQQRSAPC